jgi:hypothetical protein
MLRTLAPEDLAFGTNQVHRMFQFQPGELQKVRHS